MAIVSANLLHDGRALDAQMTGDREHRQTWRVITDSVYDDGVEVLLQSVALGVPNYGDYYRGPSGSYDTYAIVQRKSIRSTPESRKIWLVDVEYSTRPPQLTYTDNPLFKPPDYSWDYASIERVITHDFDGKPIANSAGDVFNPQPTWEEPVLVFSYTQNVADFDPVQAAGYYGAVNSDSVLGFAAGKVRCAKWTASRQYTQSIAYWSSTIELQIRDDGWELKILDRGLNMIAFNKRTTINSNVYDDDGNFLYSVPITEPVKLDGKGNELRSGADPVYLKFKPYQVKPFSVMEIAYP